MKFMLNLKNLGKKLKIIRKQLDFSQEYVAKELGVNRQAVIGIESGRRKIDSFELFKLAEIYHVSVLDIMSESKLIIPNFQDAITHLYHDNELSDEEKGTLMEFDKIYRDYEFLKGL